MEECALYVRIGCQGESSVSVFPQLSLPTITHCKIPVTNFRGISKLGIETRLRLLSNLPPEDLVRSPVGHEPEFPAGLISRPKSKPAVRTCGTVYNWSMGKHVVHISEKEAATTSLATLLAHLRAGAEVLIENGTHAVAVVHPVEPARRTISECIALLPEASTATIDPEFAKDVETAIASHREPLNPPAWD